MAHLRTRRIGRLALHAAMLLAVVAIAIMFHLTAVAKLPIDYDEDDYLRAGQQFAAAIRAGDWAAFTRENYRTEHPQLAKIAYGVALLTVPPAPLVPDMPTSAPPATALPEPQLTVARLAAASFGTLEVLLLAIVSPVAGLFLAIGTWQLKYTSEVMLEALPSLTSALVALLYLAALRWPRGRRGLLVASAVALGLTAAGKYLYCVVGIAVAVHWLWDTRARRAGEADMPRESPAEAEASGRERRPGLVAAASRRAHWLAPVLGWAGLAVAVFIAADPYLWPDPVGRLWASVTFHAGYAESQYVADAGFPPWQPFVWLFGSVPWHPGVFPISLDLVVTLLAGAGLRRAWERHRLFVVWLAVGIAFLLVWPTKWPQYILAITFPLSIVAADGARVAVAAPISRWGSEMAAGVSDLRRSPRNWLARRARGTADGARQLRRAAPWLVPGMIGLAVLALFPLLFQAAMALTDFSARSIRDGLQGGVLREAFLGLIGAHAAVAPPAPGADAPTTVNYIGPGLFLDFLSGGVASLAVFDVIWTVLSVGIQTALGVGVALLLARPGVRFAGWWRLVFVLPWAIPEFVGAVAFRNIFDANHGWISLATGTSVEWLVRGDLALVVSLLAATWSGWPLMLLAASAGLATIPRDVHDASAIDGAGRWTRFRHVTWPLLAPTLGPALLIRTVFAFNQFYVFYVFANSTDGRFPLSTLALTSFFVFDPSGGGGAFAMSAALNLVTVVMLIAFALRLQRWQGAAERRAYA